MKAKVILIPEWMTGKLQKLKQHSGQSQNAIIRLALDKYIREYEQQNSLKE